MEKILPEVVRERMRKGIDYGQLTAVLVNVIKEQQGIIKKMQNHLEDQQAQVQVQVRQL